VEDVTSQWALVTLVGPDSLTLLVEVVSAGSSPGEEEWGLAERAGGLEEGEELLIPGSALGPLRLAPNGNVRPPAWDVLVPGEGEEDLRVSLTDRGAHPMVPHTLEVLQVERGRPVFGRDMTEETIPVEAGIHTRAIDYGKGCYTGQEVIIRLRDRGQVNKELRGLSLRDAEIPPPGDELFVPEREKGVGWVTTACRSPAFQETVALAYLRRGVEPGDRVRVGSSEGPEATVRALGEDGWSLDPGEPG
jgi:folate-binding protein YgfZ